MNAVHPITYDVVKIEQEQHLARLERQREAMSHSTRTEPQTHRIPSIKLIPRRLALAAASALLMLSLIAGAVFAAATAPGAAPGNTNDAPGGVGGGGVHLLR